MNTFRIDSVAKDVYFPNSIESFIELLKELDDYIVIGGGSNVILSSTGINKPVILTTMLDKIELENNTITIQAGVKGGYLARYAQENSLSGFEFLTPIPCTIGGAVYQNAGAHGTSISDTFKNALVWDKKNKKAIMLSKNEMGAIELPSAIESFASNFVILPLLYTFLLKLYVRIVLSLALSIFFFPSGVAESRMVSSPVSSFFSTAYTESTYKSDFGSGLLPQPLALIEKYVTFEKSA